MRYLQAGLNALGEGSRIRRPPVYTPMLSRACVIWGTRYLPSMREYPTKIIMEAGYYGSRELDANGVLPFYSLGLGGLNGRADFNNQNSPSDRWVVHGVKREAWRDRGQGHYTLVMGQVPGDMATNGIDLRFWYDQIIDEIKQHTDGPVCFRPHPKARQHGPTTGKAEILGGSLEEALQNAGFVVTYNSNSGVDAALAGVPVYAADEGSMAWPIAAHTLGELFDFDFKDRSQWLYDLAYTQWTANELADGTAWKHLWHNHGEETGTRSAAQALNR